MGFISVKTYIPPTLLTLPSNLGVSRREINKGLSEGLEGFPAEVSQTAPKLYMINEALRNGTRDPRCHFLRRCVLVALAFE